MDNLQVFSINPASVVNKLTLCDLDRYTNRTNTDWAFRHLPVIPMLFAETIKQGRNWNPADLKKFLINQWMETPPNCCQIIAPKSVKISGWHWDGTPYTSKDVYERANKLVLDYCRELHTYGLLSMSVFFSHVLYEKASDVSKNLDYSAALMTDYSEVGIQAAMRAGWRQENYDKWKEYRRDARKNNEMFIGPLFYLTNKSIKADICPKTGVWLFNNQHIENLIETIKSELGQKPDVSKIGIQSSLPD